MLESETVWTKSNRLESGNFPKSSFVGVLEAIYPSYNENLKGYVLQLDFVDGKTYNIPITTKDGSYGVHENGDYDSFMAIGQFLESLEKIDVKTGLQTELGRSDVTYLQTFWGFMDDNPAGFKTEPDIVGKTLHNVATKRQIGDDQQTSKYPDWTISQIEGLTAQPASKQKGRPGKIPAKPQTKETVAAPKSQASSEHPELKGLVEDLLIETPGLSVSDVYNALGRQYKPGEIRQVMGL